MTKTRRSAMKSEREITRRDAVAALHRIDLLASAMPVRPPADWLEWRLAQIQKVVEKVLYR
jgi:hypothetical protein